MVGIRKVQLWMFVSIGVCPMADIRLPIPWHNGGEGFICPMAGFTEVPRCEDKWQPLLPNGRFVEGFHNWLVMSPIMGPSLGSELPRTILPMEVIMVSRYTSPVVPFFTTQLELTLKRPGLDTIPMDVVPMGIYQSTSTSSSVFKQAATWKSHEVVWAALLMPVLWLAGETLVVMEPLGGWMVGWWK